MRSTQYISDKRARLARGPQPLFTPNQALIDLDWFDDVNVDDFFEMAARKREDEK